VNALNNRRSLSKQRYSATGEDFSASRVWAEIDTIFEHIGNEVLTVEQEQDVIGKEQQEEEHKPSEESSYNSLEESDPRQSLHIRDPAELLLGKSQSSASQWCHSPYTLVYGEIRYSVFVSAIRIFNLPSFNLNNLLVSGIDCHKAIAGYNFDTQVDTEAKD